MSWVVCLGPKVLEFLDSRDATRLSMTTKAVFLQEPMNLVMEQRLQKEELGQSLLRRHKGKVSLPKLAYCMEYAPTVGQYFSVSDEVDLREEAGHSLVEATKNDVCTASYLHMNWVRCHFVIDGIAVLEELLGQVWDDHLEGRFGIVRISLPDLLDILEPGSFERELPRLEDMQLAFAQGHHQFYG